MVNVYTELQTKHDLKMQALRDELELRRKIEIHEIEEVCMSAWLEEALL